jgi:hypothetical protein
MEWFDHFQEIFEVNRAALKCFNGFKNYSGKQHTNGGKSSLKNILDELPNFALQVARLKTFSLKSKTQYLSFQK